MKIEILGNYMKMEVLKVKFKIWNFEKNFKNIIVIKIKILTLKDKGLRGPNTWPFR